MPISPKSKRTKLSAPLRPTIPTVEEVDTWDQKQVLQWIQQRYPHLLKDDDLENFTKVKMTGVAFLGISVEFFTTCCQLSPGTSLGLVCLVDRIKNQGKFISWT